MNTNINSLTRLAAALALCGTLAAAQATTLYDNVAAVSAGSDPLQSYGPLANSFSTGAAGGRLASVSLLLKSDSDQLVGDVTVSLLADNAVSPGAALLSLGRLSSAAISTSAFTAYSFTPVGNFELAAGTTYWIGLTAADPVAVEWAWSTDLSRLGVAGQYSYSGVLGVQANSVAGAYQMAVATVPEPGAAALMALGLVMVAGAARRTRR